MNYPDERFALTKDRRAALELLSLQEAARLANDQLAAQNAFKRDDQCTHIVFAVLNFAQLLVGALEEIFHHVHHGINRKMREKDTSIAELPEERNPIFYVYPVCMGISFVLALVWSSSRFFERTPIVALLGNLAGGMLILTGGLYCMYHVEKYIDINTVEDSQLLKHPIFVHNLIMCIVSVFGMILYFIPVWVLFDLHKNRKKSGNRNDQQSVEDEPVILYCCCVDVYRYLNASRKGEVMTHEFQVVQIM